MLPLQCDAFQPGALHTRKKIYQSPSKSSWTSRVPAVAAEKGAAGGPAAPKPETPASATPSPRSPPSGQIPRMNDCGSVAVVLEAHAAYGLRMKPIDLSACWNRIGKLSSNRREQQWLRQNTEALIPLLEQTKRDAGRLPARPLANAAHGLAKVAAATGWKPGPDVWTLFEQRGLLVVNEFEPQESSNTVWAFATAGHAAPALFDGVAKAAAPRLHEFKPQNFANTVWAFATAGHAAPALFDAVA